MGLMVPASRRHRLDQQKPVIVSEFSVIPEVCEGCRQRYSTRPQINLGV